MPELLAPNEIVQGTHHSYTVLNLIGRGGMGAVYRVQRSGDGVVWALKEMRPLPDTPADEVEENRRLFKQEAELLGQLSHPNVLQIDDSFDYDGRPMMVLEFVPGQTLEDRMRDANAPLLEQTVVGYGIQLCRVLHYLHTRTPPIIYRDLKPSNIMVTPSGVLKLIDFGVARTHKARKSKDTVAMGSAGYAPPEQYGKEQTDARSDVYALGATLLHLLTNVPPVPLQTPQPGSISQINPSVNRGTEQVIIKAMALDRNERFATGAEMEQALQRCLSGPYVDLTKQAEMKPVAPQRPPAAAPPPSPAPVRPPPASTVTPIGKAPTMTGGITCTRCGRLNKARARFCAGCGAPLSVDQPARLMVRSPRGSWELKLERLPCRIGRRDPRQNHYPELDLAEYDRGIASRHHAVIKRDGAFYTLTDLGSTNGTQLNGATIPSHAEQRLRTGDRIKIGEVEMEFRWA